MKHEPSVPHEWDVDADVVVVGFGAAGVAASVTAHDLGAKVVVLEKAPEGQEGGNTRVAGQGYLNTSSVAERWLGKRVWLYNGQRNGRWQGTAAEFIALSSDLVTELPDHVSFAEGATLGVPGMTAHRCVFVGGPVQGKTLLVTGGAGAVGHYAVQLATWAGARVIATVSSAEKAARARAGGAAHVINYRNEDVGARVLDITDGAGVDHIAEVDFGGNLAAALRCLRINGSIMIYATNGDREPRVPVRDLMQKNLAVYSMSLAGVPHPDRRRAQSDIAAWTASSTRILS